MSKPAAVVFDMDGTLFDTEQLFADSWRSTGQLHGIPIPDEVILEAVGKPKQGTVDLFAERIPGHDWATLFDECMARAHEQVEQHGMPFKGDIVHIVRTLHAHGISTGIASSTEQARIKRNLDASHLHGFFDVIVGGDDVEHGKPAPDPYLEAARLLQADPAGCVAVEDSQSGVFSAAGSGMHVILIPDLIPPTPKMRELCDVELTKLDEVLGYLGLE